MCVARTGWGEDVELQAFVVLYYLVRFPLAEHLWRWRIVRFAVVGVAVWGS